MNRLIPLFIILSLSLTYCEQKSYDDYSVVRFYGLNTTDVMELYDSGYDVWALNRISGGWVDVMLHQTQLSSVLQKHPNHEVRIPNVQTQINESEASAKLNPNPAFFDKFPNTEEVVDWLSDQIKLHPTVTRPIVIGETYNGNPIRGIMIGSNPNNPIVYFHCTIHAREWITTTTCCWMVDQILNVDPEGRDLLARANWIIVPILNVDGYDYTWSNDRMWRRNRQPNLGSTCVGTDLNRNYADHWGDPGSSPDPCSQTYRGAGAFSGVEIDQEQKFLRDLGGSLVAFVDIHAYGAQFMSPWGWSETQNPPAYPVMDYYMELSVASIQSVNQRTYKYGTVGKVLYLASGISSDWTYAVLGVIPSYTIEVFGTTFVAPVEEIEPIGKEIWAGVKALVKGIVT